jgi:RNA polymerase sigma-70 factor, ECF subfamily
MTDMQMGTDGDSADSESTWQSGDIVDLRAYLRRVAEIRSEEPLKNDHSDIVQQTLLEAHKKKLAGEAPAEPRHFRNWLRRILVRKLANAARDSLRQKRNARREVRIAEQTSDRSTRPAVEHLATTQSSPSDILARHERANRVHDALEKLPETHQQVVRMRFFDGQSTLEIAEEMGVTERSVAGVLYRSLKKLHVELIEA